MTLTKGFLGNLHIDFLAMEDRSISEVLAPGRNSLENDDFRKLRRYQTELHTGKIYKKNLYCQFFPPGSKNHFEFMRDITNSIFYNNLRLAVCQVSRWAAIGITN